MATTMKALRKVRAAKGLELAEVAVPAIGAADVLVRVSAASICGTDLHIYGWDRRRGASSRRLRWGMSSAAWSKKSAKK